MLEHGIRPLLALAHRVAAVVCEGDILESCLPEVVCTEFGARINIEVTERGGARAARAAALVLKHALAEVAPDLT